MPTEQSEEEQQMRLRQAFHLIVDQVPARDELWPPLPSISYADETKEPNRMIWRTVTATALLAVVFVAGFLLAPTSQVTAASSFVPQDEQSATAVTAHDAPSYDTPAQAAIAAARDVEPDVSDAQITRIVAIFADTTTVDLRVELTAAGSCHWYGVVGRLEEGAIRWRGGLSDVDCDQ